MIECKKVTFFYTKGTEILSDFNLQLPPGLTLLLGANGCGKTTLLRLMAGVERPDSGTILINGADLWENEVKTRSQLVYMPEHPDLTPYATIREILALVCRLRGQPITAGDSALQETGLTQQMRRTVRELSNGQRRRAMFASCLVGNPEVILLDEPLEGMDQQMQQKILSWLKDRRELNATILIASHNLQPFLPMADQAVTIIDGGAEHQQNLPPQWPQKQRLLEKLARG